MKKPLTGIAVTVAKATVAPMAMDIVLDGTSVAPIAMELRFPKLH